MTDPLFNEAEHATSESRVRRRAAPWLLGGLVLLLLAVLVALQVLGLWEVVTPDTAAETLLLYALSSLNFIAFIIFAFIFVRSLLKLRRERRARQLGSKIKTRLVVYFIAASLLPITAMALFSYIFLNRSLEKWFSRLPEDVVNEARRAQVDELNNEAKLLGETAAVIALLVDQQSTDNAAPGADQLLGHFVRSGQLAALRIVSPGGEVLAESKLATGEAAKLDEALARAVNEVNRGDAGNITKDKDFDVAVAETSLGQRVIALRERRVNAHLNRIIAGSETYERLREKQRRVRLLGLSTLGLLTLLLLFAVTWTAIHLARGIATPIRALAEAADEVARGNLAHRVGAIAEDELALLAESFNQMTAQLAENRQHIEASAAELREKNATLEERRDYIETVLESLSTGVVSLDEDDCITTINAAALLMLGLAVPQPMNTSLAQIVNAENHAVLERLLRNARRRGRAAEQTELVRNSSPASGKIPVALTAIALRAQVGDVSTEDRGVVLVMEDLSELLAAQRAAAWSEVARRMAHEIKNPLTPIQLSAERIARHFQSMNGSNGASEPPHSVDPTDQQQRVARVVEECTQTIAREIAGLKAMVDEFSNFARLPHARLELADLNEVVQQVLILYEDRLQDVRIDVRLAHTLPAGMLDQEQIRRVFVNLIDNAVESLAAVKGERRITIATGYDPARALLLAEVTDTGHGIANCEPSQLFQPYFSTRERGTGLGLAIVQRTIIEHGGRIRAETNYPRGAKFTIELPAAEDGYRKDENRNQEPEVRSQKKAAALST
ncbi:MAG: HAMP domain-containing protein, partial [Pyrinomonadaceae bacterium]|nr:HAMP domain-containing protein [Pyrinomonadaceae bacterium]